MSREASEAEIKKSYRRLARSHHPDANPGDHEAEERFKELTEAYEVLSNPEARRAYDTYGHQVPRGAEPAATPAAETRSAASRTSSRPSSATALSAAPSSGPRTARGPAAVADAEVEVEVSLREAAFGVDREVNVQIVRNCEVCDGVGGTESHVCPTCGGAGSVRTVRESILGQMVTHPGVLDVRRPRPRHRRRLRQLSRQREGLRGRRRGGCGFRRVSRAA